MIGMANNGKGQGYYGETAEDLVDPFEEEFELLTIHSYKSQAKS